MTSDASQRKPVNSKPQPDAFGPKAQYGEVDLISYAPIQSAVKWFNPKRGLGFVTLSDGSGDAFFHRNVLAQAGIDAVEPCAVVKVRIAPKDQGLQVVEVLSVENKGTVPATQSVQNTRSRGPCIEKPGTVKSFDPTRGYGFIVRDDGGKDVYFPPRLSNEPDFGACPHGSVSLWISPSGGRGQEREASASYRWARQRSE
jgi:cold shock CspA family protein